MAADEGGEFLDTNVLLYAYDSTAGQRHTKAARLVTDLARRRVAVTSVQVLQEFYINATRKIARPLTSDIAIARIELFARWPTHAPAARDVAGAAALSQSAQLSFWDAMIIWSAAEMGCSVVWSEDFNAGQLINNVRVRNPFADE